MAEAEQKSEVAATSPSAAKKDRSPSFPFITLTKAIDRARELYSAAKRHDMRLADAAAAMGYGAKSSGAIQTLAALIAYGLVEDNGTGEARKFRITDSAFKLLEDQRSGAREAALAEAALRPKAIAEYAERWRDGRPADGICISELRIEGSFTEDGAKAFLRIYDDAMRYAKVSDSDKKPGSDGGVDEPLKPPKETVSVGDWVRVEAGGQIVFEKTRVRAIEGQWVFVEASTAGAKMSDVTLIEKPAAVDSPPVLPFAREEETAEQGEGLDRFTVDEGVVKITFPAEMTADSVSDLEAFFSLFIKKAKRRAGAR